MGKKAEREVYWRRMSVSQLLGPECIQQCKLWQKWFVNKVYDAAFGYGESLWKICRTYLVVVFVFTFLYMYKGEIRDFIQAFIISFKNMAGMSSDEIVQRNDIVLNLLNLVQTTMGILITGIFGFILGNKIRNQ